MMISGAVLQYPGSVENYSAYRDQNNKIMQAQGIGDESLTEKALEVAWVDGAVSDGEPVSEKPELFATQPEDAPQEFYRGAIQEPTGSRDVYEGLLMRENADTGTTEANFELAQIKIGANAKSADERAGRAVFFDPTALAQLVKSNRDFLLGKQAVGSQFDRAE